MQKKVFLLLIGIVLANINFIIADSNMTEKSITLDYPSQVNYGIEFNVNLTLNNFVNDSYDIRLGAINSSIRLARIWNGTIWQSTYYYVNDAINTSQKNNQLFKLNITTCYNGVADMEIRVRDSNDNGYSFYNYSINITGNCNSFSNTENESEDSDEEDNNEDSSSDSDISMQLDWDSGDIKNGEEFEIKIRAYNLEDKDYDLKVFIYDNDENKPISQAYYDGKWISSTSYMNSYFKGPGDKSKTVKLRIKDNYDDFEGEAYIGVRIREKGSSSYKEEIQDTIEILEKEESSPDSSKPENPIIDDKQENNKEEIVSQSPVDDESVHHITVKSESIKSKENTIYKSKNELIKEYSIYGFAVLLLIFLVLLVFFMIKRM